MHRIYCVGRNYAEHAIEMGHDPNREPPFFFQKNPDSLVAGGGEFPYPPQARRRASRDSRWWSRCSRGGSDIPVERALDCVFGYAVGLDMTRRDLQGEAKKLGRPWEVGKAFEASAPCSEIVPAAAIGHPAKGAVWLDVNGKRRADRRPRPADLEGAGDDRLSLRPVRPCGRAISSSRARRPASVAVKRGDVLHGGVDGIGEIEVKVV